MKDDQKVNEDSQKGIAVRKIGMEMHLLKNPQDFEKYIEPIDLDNGIYKINYPIKNSILFKHNDDYLVIEKDFGKEIEDGNIDCKGWYSQFLSFRDPVFKGSFSASLLNGEQPYCLLFEKDNFSIAITIDQDNFLFGSNKLDAYTGCFDHKNNTTAPYGLIQKAMEINSGQKITDAFMPSQLGLSEQEFFKAIQPEFEAGKGKITINHIHAMNETIITSDFFNRLDTMMEGKASGEVLIHNLSANKEPLTILFPKIWQISEGKILSEEQLKIANALKSFVEKFNGKEVSFGLWEEGYKIKKAIIEPSGKVVEDRKMTSLEPLSVASLSLDSAQSR